ncbi:hypothetical protein DW175_00260 [Bacteroides sp. AM16-15]|nr:hypothetical protein DW175_00260 [Bacteroides sp. AM16-15]
MSITKCMIAGLPSSGKSTYIGALWYNLMHPAKDEKVKLVADKTNLPDDISVLNKLSDAYKDMKPIDRNYTDKNESVQINLKVQDSDEKLQVEIPDFLGENFRDLIELKESNILGDWLEETDALAFFISDVNPGEFEDDHKIEDDEEQFPDKDIAPFKISDISAAAMNIMILKSLIKRKKFKKIVIVLSWWDKKTDNGRNIVNPYTYLKEQSPALFNFIKYHIPKAEIVGLSSQGLEYPKEDHAEFHELKKELKYKTREGKRSFVEVGDNIFHDLSIPLYMLIK